MNSTSRMTTAAACAAVGIAALAWAPTASAADGPVARTVAGPVASTVVAAPSSPVLRTGSRGAAVTAWQQDVDRVAGKIPGVPMVARDGVFGPATAAATRDFQRFAGVSVDGVVGPATRAAMDTALHGAQPSS